jgi:hypothetical protein
MTDWVTWHAECDDVTSPLAQRLQVVRRLIDDAIAAWPSQRLRLLSLCAGDGRDVLPVLERWRDHKVISGRLIEIDSTLAQRLRVAVEQARFDNVEVVRGDAAEPTNYVGAVPADLIIACGIFGNVSDQDVHRTIAALPSVCEHEAFVVWTRHRRQPDLTPNIRAWFERAGYGELAFESPGPNGYAVGLHRFRGSPTTLPSGRLFTFN